MNAVLGYLTDQTGEAKMSKSGSKRPRTAARLLAPPTPRRLRLRPAAPQQASPSLAKRLQVNWTAVASILTALTAVAAVFFTGRSLNATEQGQFTDRYTRALDQISQIGDDHLQVRLGGIYALERLARDSPRDQSTIIEVLSAFVRTNSPSKTECDQLILVRRLDVQAALTVLGRRDTSNDDGAVIDLNFSCLKFAMFRGDFRGATFQFSDLSYSILVGSNFEYAYLSGANLDGVAMQGVDFDHAFMDYVTLSQAKVAGATFRGTSLIGTNFEGAVGATEAVFGSG